MKTSGAEEAAAAAPAGGVARACAWSGAGGGHPRAMMRPSRVTVPGGCTTLKQFSFKEHRRLATAVASLATDNTGPVAYYGIR